MCFIKEHLTSTLRRTVRNGVAFNYRWMRVIKNWIMILLDNFLSKHSLIGLVETALYIEESENSKILGVLDAEFGYYRVGMERSTCRCNLSCTLTSYFHALY